MRIPQHTPLGRKFIAPAEALAHYALINPVQAAADMQIEIYGRRSFAERAAITLPDGSPSGMTIDGFVKSASPAGAARQVMIGQLATLLGAPMVPYLLLLGESGIKRINHHDRHKKGCTLFSPRPFDDYIDGSDFNGPRPALLPEWNLRNVRGDGLAAAGQFNAWIHNSNFWEINLLQDRRSLLPCLIDPEESDPTQSGIDEESADFIKTGWETRRSLWQSRNYIDAAQRMAARIHGLSPQGLHGLARDNRKAGLKVSRAFVEGLIRRKQLFERPVVLTPLAERARFNMGWQTLRVLKAG